MLPSAMAGPRETPLDNPPRGTSSRAFVWGCVYFLVAVAIILQGQFRSGIFTAEFGHFPDEPAHAMTSIFFRDYFAALFPSPMPFAHNYYLHYPKIAIGIWPPLFYALAGTWLLIFGTSHASFLAFMVTIGAALGTTLSLFVRRAAGPWLGLCSGILLLCLRPLRFGTTTMMVDTTLTLMCLLATLALIRYFKTERFRDALVFGFLTALAMLTKGNANELVLVVLLMLIVLGRYYLLLRKDLYVAGVIVALVGLPWQFLSLYMLNNAALLNSSREPGVLAKATGYLGILFEQLGLIAVVGAAVFLISRIFRTGGPLEIEMAGAGCLALAVYIFHIFAPVDGPDGRYMMGALPALIFLFFTGLFLAARALGPRRSWIAYAAAAILVFAMPGDAWIVTKHDRIGLADAARILHDAPNRVILVDADGTAEGAFVVSLALLDHRPEHIVIRSTKLMSDNPWYSLVYHPKLKTPEEVKSVLDRVPVDAVLLDLTRPGWEQDSALLLRALRSDPVNWRLTNDLPVSPSNSHHLQIFRNLTPRNATATDAQLSALVEAILSKKQE
jgi:4-amino-4-deoxy-L-arabinose transferase-like glycosyltransferase